jgi:hypothetical protein
MGRQVFVGKIEGLVIRLTAHRRYYIQYKPTLPSLEPRITRCRTKVKLGH